MNPIRIFMITMALSVWISSALGQALSEDRIISGNANLSQLDKEANGAVKDAALRQTLSNSRVYAVIIQRRDTAHAAGGVTSEYWIQYAIGRDTRLHTKRISEDDYAWLTHFADSIAASSCDSENSGLDSLKAHHVNSSPQEDRGVSKSTVGENKISAEETCIVNLLGNPDESISHESHTGGRIVLTGKYVEERASVLAVLSLPQCRWPE